MQGSEKQDFAALNAPVAPFTWGAIVELPNTVQQTADVPVRFERPLELLGIKAIVVPKYPLIGTGLIVPTVDDIDVMMQTDNEDLWTKTLLESGSGGDFAPLTALAIDAPRLLRIVPAADAPDFTFRFQWTQFTQGTPLFEHAIIKLGILARYLSKAERDAYIASSLSGQRAR